MSPPQPTPPPLRIPAWERPMSWLEQRMVWTLGWGDGRNPGAIYFLLNRRRPGRSGQIRRFARDGLMVLIGTVPAVPWLAVGGLPLFLPPLAGLLAIAVQSFVSTRRLLDSGLLREVAITPVGPTEVLRDIHITAVLPVALAGIGWVAGLVVWLPLGPEGALLSALVLLLSPGSLWRTSLIGSMVAVGLDGWRPSPTTLRRAAIVGSLALLLLFLTLVVPGLILMTIGLHGSNLVLLWVPISLAPGLALTAILIWWLKRHRLDIDIGKLLVADADRVRAMIRAGIDL